MSLFRITLSVAALTSSLFAQRIEQVRLARADFDGNGVAEVVAGGRVGPYVPSDTPLSVRRARVEVLKDEAGVSEPLAWTADLQVLSDLAAGDFDGDGRPEIVTVGGGRLTVLGKRGRALVPLARIDLDGTTSRVAVATEGDGLIAATVYSIDGDGDTGDTTIELYGWEMDQLEHRGRIALRGHVGDVGFLHIHNLRGLVAETGGGEEGGDAVVWDVSHPRSPRVIWEGRVNAGRRALVVATAGPGSDVVAFGAVDGTVSMCEWTGGALRVRNTVPVGPIGDLVALSPTEWLLATPSGGHRLHRIILPH